MNNIQKVIAGLQIIAKYDDTGYDVAAGHDTFYAGAASSDKMSEEDIQAMKEAGWSWNEGLGSFFIFV